jgi:2-C-methyl-D-erythritol 4-phosphate cytidylyltransferase
MYLLIPAAGTGRRMGSQCNKLLLSLCNKPLLAWTLIAAEASRHVDWIGIIGQPVDFPLFQESIERLGLTKPVTFIIGGDTRQESVYNGLAALPLEATKVLIHDGARCLATADLFDRCSEALQTCQGLIAAIPVKDTIKVVDLSGIIEATPDRNNLWAAQTPQGFDVELLKTCHQKGRSEGWEVTDDAALFEMCQLPVKIVEGEESNIKVTTPFDLSIAELILTQRI